MIQIAGKAGNEPLEYQEADFWQPGSLNYSISAEQRMIDSVPAEEIYSWDDGVSFHVGGLVPAVALRNAQVRGQCAVEWPSDDQVFEPIEELEPGDSGSCVALEYEQARNARFAGPRPQGWAVSEEEHQLEPQRHRHVLSHFS